MTMRLEQVEERGGTVDPSPGESWSICKDSRGQPVPRGRWRAAALDLTPRRRGAFRAAFGPSSYPVAARKERM